MLKHIAAYFNVSVFDSENDLSNIATIYNARNTDLDGICCCDIIVIAVPIQQIGPIVDCIKDKLVPGQLVIDVASVKCVPTKIL